MVYGSWYNLMFCLQGYGLGLMTYALVLGAISIWIKSQGFWFRDFVLLIMVQVLWLKVLVYNIGLRAQLGATSIWLKAYGFWLSDFIGYGLWLKGYGLCFMAYDI